MSHLNLKNRIDNTVVEIPFANGKLPDFLAMTAGNYQDSHGKTWNVSTGTSAGATRRYGSCYNIPGHYTIAEVQRDLDYIGFGPIGNLGIKLEDYAASEMSLVPEDQTGQYPNIYLWGEALPDSGNQTHIYTNHVSYQLGAGMINTNTPGSSEGTNSYYVYAGIILLENTLGQFIYGVFFVQNSYNEFTNTTNIEYNFYWSTTLTSESWGEPEKDPGDKGFKPTGANTKKTRPGVGGRPSGGHGKDPEYASDPIEQPGEPDETKASAARLGFIRSYKVTEAYLQTFGECLFGSTFEGFLQGLASNPLDFVVSLNIFPCEPYTGNLTPIKMSRYSCVASPATPIGDELGYNSSGYPLTSQYKTFDFGTLSVPENWASFLDYSNTEIELYLPFIGTVSIDPSEVMAGTINVQYTVDFFTGQCVANVLCTKPCVLPSGQVLGNVHAQHSYQGNCASQIPLSKVDYGSMVGNLINACAQAITNPVAGGMMMLSDTLNGGFKPNVSSKGNIIANSGYCSVLYPYIRITRPITAEPDSYQEVVGYPSYIDTAIGDCEGLCVCEDIDVKGINGATESELAKIKQLCREGVYN